MKRQDAERFAGVLAQCRELVHLDLSRNKIGAGGAESLAGVLPQCTALAHLNLSRAGSPFFFFPLHFVVFLLNVPQDVRNIIVEGATTLAINFPLFYRTSSFCFGNFFW
jgi:hypothetical protein